MFLNTYTPRKELLCICQDLCLGACNQQQQPSDDNMVWMEMENQLDYSMCVLTVKSTKNL